MENTLQDTFHLWAKYLLYHPFHDEDEPCCRSCRIRQRLADCFPGCRMCLDGWMLTQLNRHHRTLLQEYVRSVTGSCSSWANNSSWRWRHEWRGSAWWRSRWAARRWLTTSNWYGAWNWYAADDSDSDAEGWYYYDLAVEALGALPATSHTEYPWAFHTLARRTWRSAQ